MNQKLLHDFGVCILKAQLLELDLSVLYLLERDRRAPSLNDIDAFTRSLVDIRSANYISTLEANLRTVGTPDAVLLDIGKAAKRRNHLAHRIVHDSGFLRALNLPSSPPVLDEDLRLFTECTDRVMDHFFKRAEALGVKVSRIPVSSMDQMCSFADRVLHGIQKRRKEK